MTLPREFFIFLVKRRKLYLAPVFIVFFLLGGVIVLMKGSAVAPFIYTLF
ncbi:MAG: hypothetical protein JJ899_10560 [Alphaproteobacteria bacterium]|nr:hypothetical protein [Alphaproteobacteria bacterium]